MMHRWGESRPDEAIVKEDSTMESLHEIPEIVKQLRERNPLTDRILSVYLDTFISRTPRAEYVLAFRDQCKALRPRLPETEREAFELIVKKVEDYISELTPSAPGLAVIAAAGGEYFYTIPLPQRPNEQIVWDLRPYLEPIQGMLDEFERVALVLFDSRRSRLFTIYLDQIEEHLTIDDEVPREVKSGGWAALSQSNYARHHDDHVLRHVRHTTTAINELNRTHPFDRLLLAGPEEAVAILRYHLPRPLRQKLAGTLQLEFFASKSELLAATRAKLVELEVDSERREVEALLGAATSHRVALGLDETLAALAEGRVHVLVAADDFHESGSECPTCARLSTGHGHCPVCGGELAAVSDLGNRAVEQAVRHGARIEMVTGDAAALLDDMGGLAAWTRY